MSVIGDAVSTETFINVLLCVLIICYFVYKEWPEFRKRIKGADEEAHTVEERLLQVEKENKALREMLANDFSRLNSIEKLTRANAKAAHESLEERQIIMESLLACLKGIHELGANGPTEEGIHNINAYLNRQAHVNQEISSMEDG